MSSEVPATTYGKCTIDEKIGEGGMGAVYRGRHQTLDIPVAVKVLPRERTKDPNAVARFEREMQAVGQLEHPNIVRAMDANEEDGTHYLVMEHVKGIDLSKLVHRLGPVSIPDACDLIRQAALGLQYAYKHGLVHRDIKPSNLMLTGVDLPSPSGRGAGGEGAQGCVKILDLGLALLSGQHAEGLQELTGSSQMMGTLDYMAPEQGYDSHTVDIRADIYALGATMHKLLSGEAPFGGEKYNTPVKKLMALATEPVPSIRERCPDVPEELATLIDRMTAKDPSERPSTPGEVAEVLSSLSFRERAGVRVCSEANLPGLLAAAGGEPGETKVPDKSTVSTDEYVSSAGSRTASNRPAPAIESPEAKIPASPEAKIPEQPVVLRTEVAPFTQRLRRRRPSPWAQLAGWCGSLPPKVRIAVGGGAMILSLAAIVFFLQTKDGVIRVEINDPDIEVAIKGTEIVLKQADRGKDVRVSPGDHTLVIERGDFKFETDKLILRKGETVTLRVELLAGEIQIRREGTVISQTKVPPPPRAVDPFDAKQAKKHQQTWADYLGVPVEKDIVLPGGVKLTMVLIPPGEFLMGSTDEERAHALEEEKEINKYGWAIANLPSEAPQHRVRITKPFYLGKYEVTQAQWQAVMGDNPSEVKGPMKPVGTVSWHDIQTLLAKLDRASQHQGMNFALPTEAQWEYACRAGTTTAYGFGEDPAALGQYAWCKGNSDRSKMHPVGEKKPNTWGLYDMHGNVWEWCQDWHKKDYYANSPMNDPSGPAKGAYRVGRGGWERRCRCRSASRAWLAPDLRHGDFGFRLACEIPYAPDGEPTVPGSISVKTPAESKPKAAKVWPELPPATHLLANG